MPRGAKNAPVVLLGTEQLRSGLTLTRWRSSNGYYPQVVVPPDRHNEDGLRHVKQFVTDHVKEHHGPDSRV